MTIDKDAVERVADIVEQRQRDVGNVYTRPETERFVRLTFEALAHPTEQTDDAVVERYKRVFLAGHSEGWTGNQTRRDVQHVDAEKGWALFVQNSALAKIAAMPTGQTNRVDELRAENERLYERLVETQMLAHKWMEAHDKRAAGKPYDYPKPADVPECVAENERLRAALAQTTNEAPPRP